ncbi:trypsin [Solibacillus sp. MA9]|uniref:Trypsin n=1 Tax=Solibacillus palustris TaxID=2908203 RepID=A0ABS9UAZ7_9BACL|nr:trypsin [Solibacillus sp. MA9]MCH7321515.1 trypsin [Solibacillus sp. MA9]
MLTNSAEHMKVNLFMTYDELSEYILVMFDKHELIVKVLYYKAKNDEATDIDVEKFEVVKSFTASNLVDAELMYSKWNDVRIAVPMISEYLKSCNY